MNYEVTFLGEKLNLSTQSIEDLEYILRIHYSNVEEQMGMIQENRRIIAILERDIEARNKNIDEKLGINKTIQKEINSRSTI